jgi:hypothetical protein
MPSVARSERRARIWGGLPLVMGLLLLTRCSGGNSLTGSVSQIFGSLQFNSVTVWRNDDAFQVSYYFSQFGQTDLVIQLTVELSGLNFSPGKTIDLAGTVNGAPRTNVVHQAHAQGVVNLPVVKDGTLTLSSGGQPGEETSGSFSLSFVNDTGQLGGGYTVSGSFDAVLASAEFPPDANYPADAGPDGGDGG